ncbi:hypothetical protein B0H19DRAFT_540441 [Mycena capillaripes]|nr:hypothetical protein B0H19DRAFT_540441 [Mycena capillaripes]
MAVARAWMGRWAGVVDVHRVGWDVRCGESYVSFLVSFSKRHCRAVNIPRTDSYPTSTYIFAQSALTPSPSSRKKVATSTSGSEPLLTWNVSPSGLVFLLSSPPSYLILRTRGSKSNLTLNPRQHQQHQRHPLPSSPQSSSGGCTTSIPIARVQITTLSYPAAQRCATNSIRGNGALHPRDECTHAHHRVYGSGVGVPRPTFLVRTRRCVLVCVARHKLLSISYPHSSASATWTRRIGPASPAPPILHRRRGGVGAVRVLVGRPGVGCCIG